MKVKIGEHVVDLDRPMRVREICEAEQALGFEMGRSGTTRVAVYIFAALREADPERSAVHIADEVMDMDMTELEEVEDSGPPAAGGEDPANQQTSGPPLSAVSA